MVKKQIILIVLGLLIILPLFSAYITPIDIKTMPYVEVQVVPFKPDKVSFDVLALTQKGISDQYGDINFTFDFDAPSFNLKVFIKQDGKNIIPPKTFEGSYASGNLLYLEVAPSNFDFIKTPDKEPKINETKQNITEQNQSANETSVELDKGLTGSSVLGKGGIITKYKYYFIGVIFIVAIIGGVLIGRNFSKRKKEDYSYEEPGERQIKVKKLSEFQAEKKTNESNQGVMKNSLNTVENPIQEVEEKVKELQDILNKLKNRD